MWAAAWTLSQIPNKTSKAVTPYKFFYGNKSQLDNTQVFGLKAYILVAPEKGKKVDEQAVGGLVVGHVKESKGWTFWVPDTKRLVSSAWADFGRKSLPKNPAPAKLEAKALELGNFKAEEQVAKQE
jgi:hypothetical protein